MDSFLNVSSAQDPQEVHVHLSSLCHLQAVIAHTGVWAHTGAQVSSPTRL